MYPMKIFLITVLNYWKDIDTLNPFTDIIFAIKHKDIEVRLVYMWDEFEIAIRRFKKCNLIVLESTEYWDKSLKSVVSHKEGDIHTLSILIGGYCNIARKLNIPFILKLAREWKGNMTDAQVRRRVKYITGIDYPNPHICDSVGMGLSLQKRFNVRRRKI